jgi:hypothetical protein
VNTDSTRVVYRFLLVTTFLFAPASPSAWATNYIAWNADSGTFQNNNGNGDCNVLRSGSSFDQTTKHEGSASLKAVGSGGPDNGTGCNEVSGNLPGFTHSITDGSWVYQRWWMKIGSDVVWSNQNKYKASRTLPVASGSFTGYVYAGGFGPFGECQDCTHNGSGTDGDQVQISFDLSPSNGCNNNVGGQTVSCTDWNEYIIGMHFQTGSSQNASACLWVNGKQVGCTTNWRLTSSSSKTITFGWGGLYSAVMYRQNASGTIWVDDFSADDTWNSKVGPQPLPPTLLPVQ